MFVFIPPLLPSRATEPPAGSDWIDEIKHDGFRTLIAVDGDDRSPWQRGFSMPESRPRQSRNLFGEHAGLLIGEKLIVGRLTAPNVNPAQGSLTRVDDVIVAALMAKDAP